MIDRAKNEPHRHEFKQAVGAVFETREEAKQALAALHKAHYTKSWFGTTSVAINSQGDETITAETAIGNFFSPSSMGLVDALVAHGIQGDVARSIEADIQPGEALVTVETGDRDPAEAIGILEQNGGRTELSGTAGSTGGSLGATTAARTSQLPDASTSGSRDTAAGSVSEDVLTVPEWEEEVFYMRGRR